MKIAFLIPSTTKNRPWKKLEETYLYRVFGRSFLNTLSDDIDYSIYINIDIDDPIYSKKEEKEKFERFIGEKAKIKWISDGHIQKGFLTLMWNYLFEKALEDNNEYFYQCGDDIWFENKDWIKECIEKMKKQNNIGICGPVNPPNYRILTQTLVSRKHYEIFKCYFPVQIKNWWCDDWINYVYYPNYVTKLKNLNAVNIGGEPRYSKPDDTLNRKYRHICLKLVKKGKNLLNSYIIDSK
jgi:hypothetical protein